MIYTTLTIRAMQIACEAHAGQVDKCDTPYVFHPYHLAEQMPDEVTTCVALLHDVVEDTAITLDELEREFPPEVTGPLRLLTHDPVVPYRDYVDALVVDPVACTVKRADLMHNLDETRFEGCGHIDEAGRMAIGLQGECQPQTSRGMGEFVYSGRSKRSEGAVMSLGCASGAAKRRCRPI